MTDEQIIKALECCSTNACSQCPAYDENVECDSEGIIKRALGLINRQTAEIESLKQIIDEEDKEILKLQKRIIFWREDLNYQREKIKSEAIKEFAEQLKGKKEPWLYIRLEEIDNLVKEITEE